MNEQEIRQILTDYKKITVLGLSPNTEKPSHQVPLYMASKGYDIVGIYPGEKQIAQFPIYQNLIDVPVDYRKFLDVFRRPEHIPALVDEIIKVGGVEVLWLQLGISHPEAEARAIAAGIKVVSDRCLKIEYPRLMN